jgi:hypothetical protein
MANRSTKNLEKLMKPTVLPMTELGKILLAKHGEAVILEAYGFVEPYDVGVRGLECSDIRLDGVLPEDN